MHAGPNKLEIDWECPAGGVPGRCLEWEVEHRLEGPDGKNTSVIVFYSSMIIVQRGGATCKTCVCDESEILNSVKDELSEGGFKSPSTVQHKHIRMRLLAAKHVCWIFVAVIYCLFSLFYAYLKPPTQS